METAPMAPGSAGRADLVVSAVVVAVVATSVMVDRVGSAAVVAVVVAAKAAAWMVAAGSERDLVGSAPLRVEAAAVAVGRAWAAQFSVMLAH